jgi:hypothetical protein
VARIWGRRWLALCVTIVVGLGCAPAHAQDDTSADAEPDRALDLQITGALRFNYFSASTSADGERNLLGATLQVKAQPKLGEALDANIEARFSVPDIRGRHGYSPDAELLEGYATGHFAGTDLRLGKQIVAWGRADGINPTDTLTPRNYRVALPFEEDQRFGIWGARVTAPVGHALTLTLFASPDFEPHKLPLPVNGLAVRIAQPGHSFKDFKTAAKLDRSGGAFDWSVSYSRGPSLLPTVERAGSVLEIGYGRAHVLGADFARNVGRFGVRGEIAYTIPADRGGSIDPNAKRSWLFLVLGADRTFQENLNVNVQVLMRWMPGRQNPHDASDPEVRLVGALNELIRGQESEFSPGVTFRVSNLWRHNTLRAEVFGAVNAKRGDMYVRPYVSYDITDQLRASLGANLYAGPRSTPFGALRPASGLFAELRRGF